MLLKSEQNIKNNFWAISRRCGRYRRTGAIRRNDENCTSRKKLNRDVFSDGSVMYGGKKQCPDRSDRTQCAKGEETLPMIEKSDKIGKTNRERNDWKHVWR